MLIAINRSIRQLHSRVGLLVAVIALSGAVVVAHGAMGASHMNGGTMLAEQMTPAQMAGDHTSKLSGQGDLMIAMCLAIAETAAVALGALALGVAMRSLWRLLPAVAWPQQPRFSLAAVDRVPRARPPDLSLLQVFRR